jgi:hypothetical protein
MSRRRGVLVAAAAAAAVALGLAGLNAVRGEPRRVAVAVTAGSPGVAALPSPTGAPPPADDRLQAPYVASGYGADSACLCSFRVLPAPAQVGPRLTGEQALAAFDAAGAGPLPAAPTAATVRFGLFDGNVSNPPGAGGRLTGVHPVREEPAWMIVFDGIRLRSASAAIVSGGDGAPPGLPERTGYAVAVVSDATGALLSELTMTGGSSGVS